MCLCVTILVSEDYCPRADWGCRKIGKIFLIIGDGRTEAPVRSFNGQTTWRRRSEVK
jgi:hypothetical protein